MSLFSNEDWTFIPNAAKDAGVWAYTWQENRPAMLSAFLQEGAQIVTGKDEALRLFGPAGEVLLDSRGWIVKYEFVLLRWPWARRVEIAKIEQEKADQAVYRTRSGDAAMEAIDGLKNRHISGFVVDAEEHEDRKEFETRPTQNRVSLAGASKPRATP
jgi:hypothetical protein